MGFLNFCNSTSSQSHIIYTDNVQKKSSFSLTVTDVENKNMDFKEISKHIAAFEESFNKGTDIGSIRTGKNGNLMVVTELGANYIFQDTTSSEEEEQTFQVSATYKWLVFVSAFLILMMDVGLAFNFGTLFPTVLEEFGESRASTAAIQSVFIGIGQSLGIVAGIITQRFGPRKCGIVGGIFFSSGMFISIFATSTVYLQLSFGVLAALGFSLLYICPNQILTQLFQGQARFLCLSILSSAPSIGGLFFPYLLQWLGDTFGLNGTFLLLGGMSLNTIPLAALWNTRTWEKKIQNHTEDRDFTGKGKKKTEIYNLFKSAYKTAKYKPFLFLFVGIGLSLSTINVNGILAMDILETNGLSAGDSITVIFVTNTASIASRIIPSLTNKIRGYSSVMTTVLASLTGSSGMLLLIFLPNFTGSIIASAIIGVSRGCLFTSMSVVTIEILDVTRFSTGLGLVFGLVGLITTVMGPICGLLRDIGGSYIIPLYGTTAALLVGSLLCTVSMILHSRAKSDKKRERPKSIFNVTRF